MNVNDPAGPDGLWGTGDDGLRLQTNSPCVDMGNNAGLPQGSRLDILGRTRVVDGNGNGDAVTDMGAYEFSYAYMGDFDYDCEVNFDDFAVLAESWELDKAAIDIAPFGNPDGIIDFEELLVIADHWLEGVLPW